MGQLVGLQCRLWLWRARTRAQLHGSAPAERWPLVLRLGEADARMRPARLRHARQWWLGRMERVGTVRCHVCAGVLACMQPADAFGWRGGLPGELCEDGGLLGRLVPGHHARHVGWVEYVVVVLPHLWTRHAGAHALLPGEHHAGSRLRWQCRGKPRLQRHCLPHRWRLDSLGRVVGDLLDAVWGE